LQTDELKNKNYHNSSLFTLHYSLKNVPVPFWLRLYLKKGFVKLELGVCRGKALHDKRDSLKKKAMKRDMERDY
jgi:tmRNA-binding protein